MPPKVLKPRDEGGKKPYSWALLFFFNYYIKFYLITVLYNENEVKNIWSKNLIVKPLLLDYILFNWEIFLISVFCINEWTKSLEWMI